MAFPARRYPAEEHDHDFKVHRDGDLIVVLRTTSPVQCLKFLQVQAVHRICNPFHKETSPEVVMAYRHLASSSCKVPETSVQKIL